MLKASSHLRSADLRLFLGCRDFMSPNVPAYQPAQDLTGSSTPREKNPRGSCSPSIPGSRSRASSRLI
ncbi:hypothetical protein BCR35DRAFT_305476 [Leucosporidium creatinivorum]|uniref:Uncharacterized protein n=1 Tax=Leucosporidium creatinivorum TaxID=106004 RepID=A0A1Y2F130_9BASI|nr:hypothetical protein BCR35DRAFT_305476 [Leucosporidium creatinivorum]